jgi:hypothetical protein
MSCCLLLLAMVGHQIELTDDYKRTTEQFKDLQRKFRHFEMVDSKKYKEVWEMNEESVMKAVRKVLKVTFLPLSTLPLYMPHWPDSRCSLMNGE